MLVKRALEWKTLDLGYPSAIAVIWFMIIFGLSLLLTRVLQRREVLEFSAASTGLLVALAWARSPGRSGSVAVGEVSGRLENTL